MRQENVESESRAKRPAGRPRSESSRASILDAAYSFLEDRPVASISLLHIARKAGVSSATVYRWWPTKEALLLDAFLNKADRELVLKNVGSPLQRLKEYILQVGRFFTGESGIVAARLLTALQDNPILRKEFLERVYLPREKEFQAVVKEAIKLRQLPAAMEVSVFLDSIIGPLLARLLIRREQIDEAFVLLVFDRVVAGTLAQESAR
ncbi:MAG: TetR/AcrR family transcriptional regulator [Terracidiphilus sp.]|jgi:AcrR family transcriptional regulator